MVKPCVHSQVLFIWGSGFHPIPLVWGEQSSKRNTHTRQKEEQAESMSVLVDSEWSWSQEGDAGCKSVLEQTHKLWTTPFLQSHPMAWTIQDSNLQRSRHGSPNSSPFGELRHFLNIAIDQQEAWLPEPIWMCDHLKNQWPLGPPQLLDEIWPLGETTGRPAAFGRAPGAFACRYLDCHVNFYDLTGNVQPAKNFSIFSKRRIDHNSWPCVSIRNN